MQQSPATLQPIYMCYNLVKLCSHLPFDPDFKTAHPKHPTCKSEQQLLVLQKENNISFTSISQQCYWDHCCRKEDPFQGLKLGSCIILGNELSKETYLLTKQEILLGKGTWVESSRVREPRRTALSHGLQSPVLWCWDQFLGCPQPIILTQSPSWWCMPCSAKMDAREKDSGRWSDRWCLLQTFPELFWFLEAYQFPVPYQDLLS